MLYFEHTPKNVVDNQPERLALIIDNEEEPGNREVLDRVRRDLVTFAIERYVRYGIVPHQVTEVANTIQSLATAPFNDLPVEIVANLLIDDEKEDALPILDAETNLLVWVNEDTGSFEIFSSAVAIDPIEESEEPEKIISDPEADRLIAEYGFNATSFQIEPDCDNEAVDSDYIMHRSLGFICANGRYVPVMTVLNALHPVRQAVELSNQTQPAETAEAVGGEPTEQIEAIPVVVKSAGNLFVLSDVRSPGRPTSSS